jgi:hypothetical protein
MAEEPPRKYNLRISDADCPMISFNASILRTESWGGYHLGKRPLRVVGLDLRDLSFFRRRCGYNYRDSMVVAQESFLRQEEEVHR